MLHTSVAAGGRGKDIKEEEKQDPVYQLGFQADSSSIPVCPHNRENQPQWSIIWLGQMAFVQTEGKEKAKEKAENKLI